MAGPSLGLRASLSIVVFNLRMSPLCGAADAAGLEDRRIVVQDTASTSLAALGIAIPGDWQGQTIREALAPR